MSQAPRDQNRITTLLGVSSADGTTPLPVQVDPATGAILVAVSGAGSGDVSGPGSSTDNAVVRWNGATGTAVQNSAVIIDDTDNVTGMTTLTLPNTGLHILDTNATHDLIIVPGSNLTADRNFTITTGDAARTLTLAGDLSTSGANNLILTTTGATNVTLPTSGTLVNDAVTTLSSLVSVGTITTGVWNATDIAVTAGGTGLSAISALSIWVANSANTITEVTPGAGNSIRINGAGNAWEAFTPSSAVPTAITVANEAADANCFPLFVTAATGDLGPKSNAGLTFNSTNALLTSTLMAATTSLTTASVLASSDDSGALGASGTAFSDLFLASGGVINWSTGDVTITHSANAITVAGGSLVLPDAGLTVGASVPFSDAAGTLTLQNVDALDATTEATVEAAIDTLANLTSIQGRTVTLADAGANAIFGWDDTASAYENLTQGEVLAVIGSSSTTAQGVVEIAIASEVNTGTDATRAISPDALAGSNLGTQPLGGVAINFTTAVTTGDGKLYFPIPAKCNGMNLIRAQAYVITAGTTNATTVMVHNRTQAADMLSGAISIASGGTVGTVGTIDTGNDDVATDDIIRIDVDSVSTTPPQGLLVMCEFQLP